MLVFPFYNEIHTFDMLNGTLQLDVISILFLDYVSSNCQLDFMFQVRHA